LKGKNSAVGILSKKLTDSITSEILGINFSRISIVVVFSQSFHNQRRPSLYLI